MNDILKHSRLFDIDKDLQLVYNTIVKVHDMHNEDWIPTDVLNQVINRNYGCIIGNNEQDVAVFYITGKTLFIMIALATSRNNPFQLYMDDFKAIKNHCNCENIEFMTKRKGYLKHSDKFKIKQIIFEVVDEN